MRPQNKNKQKEMDKKKKKDNEDSSMVEPLGVNEGWKERREGKKEGRMKKEGR